MPAKERATTSTMRITASPKNLSAASCMDWRVTPNINRSADNVKQRAIIPVVATLIFTDIFDPLIGLFRFYLLYEPISEEERSLFL